MMNRDEINAQINLLADVHFRGCNEDILESWALYWEYADGTEGGMIDIECHNGTYAVVDYDGAFELPLHVRTALESLGIET